MFNTKKFLAASFALASFALASAAKADTMKSVQQYGVFTTDNVNGISVWIDATQQVSAAKGAPTTSYGDICINGVSGNDFLGVNANVASVTFDTTYANGRPYNHVHIVSQEFYFYDMATDSYAPATAQIDLTDSNLGTISFQINKSHTGTVLAKTPGKAAAPGNAPLVWGETSIAQYNY